MARVISASIDLSKIDETRVITGKNGARYYNLDINVNDEKNQYGQDVSITTSQTKGEREAKMKKTYIGSGKTVWSNDRVNTTPPDFPEPSIPASEDDLPF